ncbi:MAG: AAA family ATPase [Proteobacteria bacterium]|nr:AAA family ATPase [Pseudomonadota bacterium]
MEHSLWVEKYRPRTIEDAVLPSDLKNTFQTYVDGGNVPNLLLSGSAGVGKTTVARAMLEQLDCDYIVINGSLQGNIDTLRTDIQHFASAVSLQGGRKYVILDEADYLNPQSTQPALRNFMEEYSRNCGFILTCNFKNRIIEPLHSRCSEIVFKMNKDDKPKMASQFFNRVLDILGKENIEYDKKVVVEVVSKYFPDYRRILNELQRYSATGKIDTGILSDLTEENLKSVMSLMKEKKFTDLRKWVGENSDIDSSVFFRKLYDTASDHLEKQSIPQLILILSDYQYKAAFVADPEINIMACLTQIMVECQFK